jgi:ATP-binding cassette subfamily B protein
MTYVHGTIQILKMKKRILIISKNSFDLSTEDVMDWIWKEGHQVVRVNGDDFDQLKKRVTVEQQGGNLNFYIDGLNLDDFDVVWLRRWSDANWLNDFDLDIPFSVTHAIVTNIAKELAAVRELLFYRLKAKMKITSSRQLSVNKLIVFEKALEAGFNIPEYLITNSREELKAFQKKYKKVICKDINNEKATFTIADPERNLMIVDRATLIEHWYGSGNEGMTLLLEPTPFFYDIESEKSGKVSWRTFFFYFAQYKKFFFQLLVGLFVGSLLQLIFPFLTQSIVDVGITTNNLSFIYVILIAQFSLSFFRAAIEFIRGRLLLFISSRINISLLTGFWYKLMRLPLSYFDTKLTGDIQQRIQDQHNIESFLTNRSIIFISSIINLIIFSIVLFIYSLPIFTIFSLGSLLYFVWIRLFFKQRRNLNYKFFELSSKENSATMQLIQGMQEIKLKNSERFFRWDWEQIRVKLFKLNFKSLSLNQYQQAGAIFINESINITITFFVARLVLEGHLTLGAMLAIQYIVGQLNGPVDQIVEFTQSWQDAKIALERLNEINLLDDEEPKDSMLQAELPERKAIFIKNLSFSYAGAGNLPVLNNITISIPENKVTAIVGMSGSGKTTILKLLLKFYENYQGDIKVGESSMKYLSPSFWRGQCGSVMQDGYIFNDTIGRNIAVGEDVQDRKKLAYAAQVANILPFVESLPHGFNTKIGMEGNGISQGQRQRILIARAVYSSPAYMFFDEATNALDANNEKVIMDNLNSFFRGRTVIVVAHRLSTVKNADKIVVLHQGEIVEEGNHMELSQRKGYYYELVKNQLELGN